MFVKEYNIRACVCVHIYILFIYLLRMHGVVVVDVEIKLNSLASSFHMIIPFAVEETM